MRQFNILLSRALTEKCSYLPTLFNNSHKEQVRWSEKLMRAAG